MNDYWIDLPDPPNHRQRWSGLTMTPKDDARALEQCKEMSENAGDDESYIQKCLAGEKVFYLDYPYGLMPGHVYSEDGVNEFRISGACEYHFDVWCADPDEGAGNDYGNEAGGWQGDPNGYDPF